MRTALNIILVILLAGLTTADAQGPLTPAGAPATSMKTLQQVEPRTPISSVPYLISQSGSYYLTTNLTGGVGTDGITINVGNVSLDLNGFTLSGVPGSKSGIMVSLSEVLPNISIRNGHISSWGTVGLNAVLSDNAYISGVHSYSNETDGIQVGNNSMIKDCFSQANGGVGIYAYEGSTIRECSARGNGTDGIQIRSYNTVIDNICIGNGTSSAGAGIRATNDGNLIKNNNIQNNVQGIRLDGSDNEIAGNMVLQNTLNYNIADHNRLNILLSDLPEDIYQPALVELAGTLYGTQGITISSDNVTIDLKGHALIGVGGSTAIQATTDVVNITVRNGAIQDWTQGIDLSDADNCIITDLTIHDISGDGLTVGNAAVISKCTAHQCTGDGIKANQASVITECSAWNNGGSGIEAGAGSTVKNCSSRENTLDGFRVGNSSTISECSASGNLDNGILAGFSVQIINNNCDQNSDAGIRVDFEKCRIDANTVTLNDYGIRVTSIHNLIVRNSASINSTIDYSVSAGNGFGGTVNATASFTNYNPWVNFIF